MATATAMAKAAARRGGKKDNRQRQKKIRQRREKRSRCGPHQRLDVGGNGIPTTLARLDVDGACFFRHSKCKRLREGKRKLNAQATSSDVLSIGAGKKKGTKILERGEGRGRGFV